METVNIFSESETVCWQKVKEADQEAFRRIYNKYWNYLHTIAYNFTKNSEQADDLVQDVFVDLWKNKDRIDTNKPPLPYLKSMIKFKVISYLRHLSLSQSEAFVARVKDELYQNGTSNLTNETLACNDLKKCLDSCLVELPEKSRRIFELSRFENYTNQEIANKLNISIKTVEYHISKGLALLKPRMRQLTDVAFVTAYTIFIFRG